MNEGKSLKQYCREAKKRLKAGFWQNYQKDLSANLERAERAGISTSKVKQYYAERVSENIKSREVGKEEFYLKVKKLLEEEGEVADAIGRLTDHEYYQTLDYEEKQRYSLSLSEKYLQAVERFRKEKALEINA
ncbi:MAG: hypothetical protein J6C62_08880 [Clostridia bacterium]|nr:hypothetical protein [Clostridia bacterium]